MKKKVFTLTLLKLYSNFSLLGGGTVKNVTTDDSVERSKETTGLSMLPQKYHTVILGQRLKPMFKAIFLLNIKLKIFKVYTQRQLSKTLFTQPQCFIPKFSQLTFSNCIKKKNTTIKN